MCFHANRSALLIRQDEATDLDVAKQILRYFYRNPKAADTVEGVARWRLLEEMIQSNLETVMKAMAWLVSQGLLVKESRPASAPLFRLNTAESKKIEKLLTEGTRARKRRKQETEG
jgi:hypothetical protein